MIMTMSASERENSCDSAASSSGNRLEALTRAHVSLIRPNRKGRKVFSTLDQAWLEQSSPVWPRAAKERIYRYVHTRNLYQMSIDDATLVDLAKSVVEAAGLPSTFRAHEEVAKKCLSLLQPAVRSWKREGLIIRGPNDKLIKCPVFQKLWDHEIRLSPNKKISSTSSARSPTHSIDEENGERLTSQYDKYRSPRKRTSEACEHPANPYSSKRQRVHSYAEDDTEDCIVVSVPGDPETDAQSQFLKEDGKGAYWEEGLPTAQTPTEEHTEAESPSISSPIPAESNVPMEDTTEPNLDRDPGTPEAMDPSSAQGDSQPQPVTGAYPFSPPVSVPPEEKHEPEVTEPRRQLEADNDLSTPSPISGQNLQGHDLESEMDQSDRPQEPDIKQCFQEPEPVVETEPVLMETEPESFYAQNISQETEPALGPECSAHEAQHALKDTVSIPVEAESAAQEAEPVPEAETITREPEPTIQVIELDSEDTESLRAHSMPLELESILLDSQIVTHPTDERQSKSRAPSDQAQFPCQPRYESSPTEADKGPRIPDLAKRVTDSGSHQPTKEQTRDLQPNEAFAEKNRQYSSHLDGIGAAKFRTEPRRKLPTGQKISGYPPTSTPHPAFASRTALPHMSMQPDRNHDPTATEHTPSVPGHFSAINRPPPSEKPKPTANYDVPRVHKDPRSHGVSQRHSQINVSQLLSPPSREISPSSLPSKYAPAKSDRPPSSTFPPTQPTPSNHTPAAWHPTDITYQPPPVTFTESEHLKTDLHPELLNSLMSPFETIARISINSPTPYDGPAKLGFYHIRAIMLSGLEKFYQWYSQVSSSQGQPLLRFELTDLTCKTERGFMISEHDPNSFRLLKQYIWDSFWSESRIRGALQVFTITIEPYQLYLNTVSHQKDRNPPTPTSIPSATFAREAQAADAMRPSSETNYHPHQRSSTLPKLPGISISPRTSADKITLRMVAERTNSKLFEDEISGNGSTLRTEPLVGCGAIIDMRSGIGTVVIPGKNNTGKTTISTDPQSTGHPYVDVRIPDGAVCEIHGYASLLLYYHNVPNQPPLLRPATEINTSSLTSSAAPTPEMLVRIQVSSSGKFSLPYHKDVLRPGSTSTEFFDWFQNEVNNVRQRSNWRPNSNFPPRLSQLCFTLKDAMPMPKSGILNRGDDAHFTNMRRYIKEQFETAKGFCPGLREFTVLVSIPGTTPPYVSENE